MVPMKEALRVILIALCLAKGNCTDTEFQCNSGECIPMGERCNSIPQCKDHSDEANCHFGSCIEGQHLCTDGVTCIPPDKWCDGTVDCPDSSDEHPSCGGMTTTTSSKSSPSVPLVTNTCIKNLHASTTAANTGGMTTTTPTPTTSSPPVCLFTITCTNIFHASTPAANTAICIIIVVLSALFILYWLFGVIPCIMVFVEKYNSNSTVAPSTKPEADNCKPSAESPATAPHSTILNC